MVILGRVSRMKGCDVTCVLTGLSDEILLSSDKTIAIIDGSGVLHDPVGLNREELVRLAKARKPVAFFDTSKLDRKSTRLNSSHSGESRMPSSA